MYLVYINNKFVKAFDLNYDEDKIYTAYKHRYPREQIEILNG